VAARPAARTAPGLKKSGGFAAYGTPSPNVPDPMSRSVEGLLDELGRLRTRIEQLESDSSDEQNQSVSGEEAADGKNDVIPPNC